jgi:CheY-like chemotaxis protein
MDALDKLSEDVQIVLMDVHMPLLDGVSSTALLLKSRPALPVIFLTADVTPETEKKCREAGGVAVLTKPANKSLIVTAILHALGRRRPSITSSTSPMSPLAPLRCLVVDDNNTNLMLAGHLMHKVFGDNVDVVFAENGQVAVNKVVECCPDVILMDVNMPVMNGVDAALKIRQMQLPHPVLIVGITGMDDSATVKDCKEAGMDQVLTKPLRDDQLRPLVAVLKEKGIRYAAPKPTREASPELVDDRLIGDLDPAFRKKLLDDWQETCTKQSSSMKDLLAKGEWKGLRDVAHSLKGSSAQLGAVQLSQIALQVERMCKETAPSSVKVRAKIEDLCSSFTHTLAHFSLARSTKGSPS